MPKRFNVTGDCKPAWHYMVDITDRLMGIEKMIEQGDYFTINRPRQYGKTTTLRMLAQYLKERYLVVSLDFQTLDESCFAGAQIFARSFAREFYIQTRRAPLAPKEPLEALKRLYQEMTSEFGPVDLRALFLILEDFCAEAPMPVVLLIDEVDTASNNQVFLDFLAQLRFAYLNRDVQPTFQSVILAGVHDVKNLKRKFVEEGEHKTNSPWNISASYLTDMSFSVEKIAELLQQYEADYHTGMDIAGMAREIYEYTSGYPVLVSRICKLLDEELSETTQFPSRGEAWSVGGIRKAVGIILQEKNPLFGSLLDKVTRYPELDTFLRDLLMEGKEIGYHPDDPATGEALLFGFAKVLDGRVVVANRIFETRLYDYFLTSQKMQESVMYSQGAQEKYQFIKGNTLDMRLILERFVSTFHGVYGEQPEKFLEEEGRRFFLLYLWPIINGKGNYYIEAQTRDQRRMDVVVDYCGKRYVIEMKIWHGNEYNKRGEEQLLGYLDYFGLQEGYLLSFNFNREKRTGVQELAVGGRTIVEAVV